MLSKVATTPRGNNSTGVEPNIDQGHNLTMAKKPTLDEMRLALTRGKTKHEHAHEKARLNAIKMLGLHEHNTAEDRARALGFNLEEKLYHGTNSEFPAFEKHPRYGVGTYATEDPEIADIYAMGERREGNAHPNVLPIVARGKKLTVSDLHPEDPNSGGWFRDNMAKAVGMPKTRRMEEQLPTHGYDRLQINDMSDLGGVQIQHMFPDPKVIRSRFAAFDPHRVEENDLLAAKGGEVHMAEGGLTWNSPEWKPHPENDLLHTIGASKMVGDEKLLFQDDTFSHGLSEFPSSKKSYRYLYHGEDKKPIGSMQIQTTGPRSKKAVIQNLYVAEANRRQGIASKLLDRARQDFDVKHSTDLTTSGKAFAKAKKAKGGVVKYPSIEEMLQKLQEAGRTPIMPAPDRWFKNPEKHPYQQKAIEKLLEYTGHNREAFPHGAHINPITGEPLDFEIMHDLGVAIDPVTGTPRMSGIKSELTEIDPRLGSLTKSNLIRKGLFKHEGGDPLLDRIKFLATIEKSGKGHHYGLSTHYESPAELVQEMKGNPTLRPHSRGDIYGVGDEVGRISIKGKHHPVYEKLLVAPSGMDVQGKKLHKAKGGITHAHHLEIEERPL